MYSKRVKTHKGERKIKTESWLYLERTSFNITPAILNLFFSVKYVKERNNSTALLYMSVFLFKQFNLALSHLFALSLNVKQFYSTLGLEPNWCHHSRPEWTWEQWQWGALTVPQRSSITGPSPLHSFLSYQRYSLGRVSYPSAEMKSVYSGAPADWAAMWMCMSICLYYIIWGARGVMVIVIGNEHGDTSSNPGRDWIHFT